ncbi:MAG TPA: right-handed parallel beta-helix repeat-containing protein [Bacteroidetes bacterium]|nr:right-handed parallel beta-helix repeat-containing protein [Bacteroidota bacterium]HEX05565.1 right-handed parallel beta-helix repeat-containing protein [Bacteroidota bacterium]
MVGRLNYNLDRFKARFLRAITLISCVTIAIAMLNGCELSPNGSDDEDNEPISAFELYYPSRLPIGTELPYVLREVNTSPRLLGWETANITTTLQFKQVQLKRGFGSGRLSQFGQGVTHLSVANGSILAEGDVEFLELPERSIAGTLAGSDLNWNADTVIVVTDNITVPSGSILRVTEGTVVLLHADVRLDVEGEILVSGTREAPVLFTAVNPGMDWGEINIASGYAQFEWTFFTHGGGDESRSFGHSNSQPVLRVDEAIALLNHCFFLDNEGKAIGSREAQVTMDSSLVMRNDTGGEHHRSVVMISNTGFLDMPTDDGVFVDDDNDAIYLNGAFDESSYSEITDCVFVTGKDDAIDHNGALLRISNCLIEDFAHEGVAASNTNRAYVLNTLILGCNQGIEAGYGTPEVIVDHCVLVGNNIGLRFGDEYTSMDDNGNMTITNTISVENLLHNVWNYDPLLEGPRDDVMSITYSMVNDTLYDNETGNVTGEVTWLEGYLLAPNSVGVGMAEDGSDMGLIP